MNRKQQEKFCVVALAVTLAMLLALALAGCATLSSMAAEEARNSRRGSLDPNGRVALLFPDRKLAEVRRMECVTPKHGFGPDLKLPCWGEGQCAWTGGPGGGASREATTTSVSTCAD